MHATTRSDGSLLLGAVKGMAAGAVGTWALDQVVNRLYEWEAPARRRQEERARPEGLPPAELLAKRAGNAVGVEMTKDRLAPAATGVHYGLGVVPGALYGAVRGRVGGGLVGGLLLGLGLFVVQDEGLNWAMGTAGPPDAYPWEAHARGLAGHLAYGLATECTLAVLDRVA